METWKDIPNYEGYYKVSSHGRVKSVRFNRILKNQKDTNGYPQVLLSKKGKQKIFTVHKLMGIAFFNFNSNYHMVIHHKDNNKKNNKIDNLEIVTRRNNTYTHHKGTSKYRGVCKRKNGWEARIYINGKDMYLGLFNNEYDAHLAYQKELNNIKNPDQKSGLMNHYNGF